MVLPLLLPALFGIASEAAPALIRMASGSDKAADIGKGVVDVIGKATGLDVDTPEGAEKAAALIAEDPNVKAQVVRDIKAIEAAEVDALLRDTQNARNRDMWLRQHGGGNSRATAMVGLVWALLVICIGAAVYLAMQPEISAQQWTFATGILGTVLGWTLKTLSQPFEFEFGSSRGSKAKSAQIDTMMAQQPDPVENTSKLKSYG